MQARGEKKSPRKLKKRKFKVKSIKICKVFPEKLDDRKKKVIRFIRNRL